jgi:hypothetical protein
VRARDDAAKRAAIDVLAFTSRSPQPQNPHVASIFQAHPPTPPQLFQLFFHDSCSLFCLHWSKETRGVPELEKERNQLILRVPVSTPEGIGCYSLPDVSERRPPSSQDSSKPSNGDRASFSSRSVLRSKSRRQRQSQNQFLPARFEPHSTHSPVGFIARLLCNWHTFRQRRLEARTRPRPRRTAL